MRSALYRQMAEVEERHWWFVGRRAIVESIIKELPLGSDARILDAGCGTGGNLSMLSRYGRVDALEHDEQARRLANEKSLATVVAGTLPHSISLPQGEFDLITLLDVLEHVDDDRGSLQALLALLKPGGYLVITVPCYEFLWSAHDDTHHHRRRYTLSKLRALAKDCGFNVIYDSYFNTLLFPIAVVARLATRLLKARGSSDLKMPHPLLNRALGRVFKLERHLLSRLSLPFGVSAILLATK